MREPFACPFDERVEIAFAVAQTGLDDNAKIAEVRELRLVEQTFEKGAASDLLTA